MPGQPSLDADEFSAAVTAVTSAFGDPTRRDIYLLIRDTPDGVTASEVAEHFDLHSNVARHHLEKLTAGGYLVVAVGRTDGTRAAGRPSKRYRVSELDHSLNFPPRRDDLLGTLLARALQVLPPEQAETLEALVRGCKKVPNQHGYYRAIAGFRGQPRRGAGLGLCATTGRHGPPASGTPAAARGGCGERDLVTSRVQRIERPERAIVASYRL